jgi:YVTN family beta-propeller protein
MKRLTILIAFSLIISSCQARQNIARTSLEAEGGLFVYIAPLPAEARRLSFRLTGLDAIRPEGERVPLTLVLADINGKDVGRERLLASGNLPPGRYSGISLHVEKASLAGEEGMAAMRLQEGMTVVSIPFVVENRRAVLLSLEFRFPESVRDGFLFAPAFYATIPGRPPTGLIGLVSSSRGNTVAVFNKLTGKVVSVIPTGASPGGMAIDAARGRAYVAIAGEDAVEVIDLLDVRLIDRLSLAGGDAPVDLAISSDGRTLLSANSGSNTVSILDPVSRIEKNRVRVGNGPRSLLLDRTGRKAYVFNAMSDSISVLDVPRGTVTQTVSVESGPEKGQLSRDGKQLYVLQRLSPNLGVIDTASLSVAGKIYVGPGREALKVDSKTGWIYLARSNEDGIDVYDPFSLLPMAFIRAGGDAGYITIDDEQNNLCVVLPENGRVRLIRLGGHDTAAEIDIADGPNRAILMGERQ